MVETSHYAVLRVPVNATPDQIRAAYKRRAIETHPDKTNDDGEAFKAVQAAYTILQDASRRAWYDREQVTPPRPPFAAARRPPTEQDYDEMKRRAAEVAAGLDRAAARRSAEAQRAAAWKAHLAREAREREEAAALEREAARAATLVLGASHPYVTDLAVARRGVGEEVCEVGEPEPKCARR